MLVPSVAQQTLEETSLATVGEPPPAKEVDVPKTYPPFPDLFRFSEQTAGAVIQMCRPHEEEAPRKVWPVKPDSQVLRVLQEAELQPLTQELGNVSLCDDDSSSPGSSSALFACVASFQTCQRELSFYSSWNLSFSKVSFNIVMQLLYFCI